jgi:hypothetical protein
MVFGQKVAQKPARIGTERLGETSQFNSQRPAESGQAIDHNRPHGWGLVVQQLEQKGKLGGVRVAHHATASTCTY